MKELVKIDSKAIILSLSMADSWPPLWYYREAKDHKAYKLLSIGITVATNKHDWVISLIFFSFTLIFGFPWLCLNPNGLIRERNLKDAWNHLRSKPKIPTRKDAKHRQSRY